MESARCLCSFAVCLQEIRRGVTRRVSCVSLNEAYVRLICTDFEASRGYARFPRGENCLPAKSLHYHSARSTRPTYSELVEACN